MAQVLFAARARADFEDIWLQVALNNGARLADGIIDRIERRTAMLARHPDMGPARPEIGERARSLLIERWLILYRVDADAVRIIRIVDGARDLKRLAFDERP